MKLRISLEAEKLLNQLSEEDRSLVMSEISSSSSAIITVELINKIIGEKRFKETNDSLFEKKLEIKRGDYFKPVAKEYEPRIKPKHEEDVTGKSRSKGTVADFVAYFRNRFLSFRSLFSSLQNYDEINVEHISKNENMNNVKLFCMVYDIMKTKSGNTMLIVEDMTGMARAIISKESRVIDKISTLTRDDVIMLYGKTVRGLFIVEDIDFPDVPVSEFPIVDRDLSIVYISDTHFGSRYFNESLFKRFLRWLKGYEGNQVAQKIAGKVKYIILAGDVVDGIGIYPGQEKELVIKDIFKQYEIFDKFVEELPDYIEVIVTPGNHDAVRRAEPMPAISDEIIKSDVLRLGNPASVEIEGVKHLVYHGTSMDSLIAAIPKLSYDDPKDVMAEYIKKRHLSSIYGGNPIVPEKIDYMLIRTLPNVIHTGHVHKYARGVYRNIALINSATFQDQTDFQIKQGHVPSPGVVPVLQLKTSQITLFDFRKENLIV